MTLSLVRFLTIGAAVAAVQAQSCPTVSSSGESVGEIIDVNGVSIYVSTPAGVELGDSNRAILHISDIFGVPYLQNRLLADSFARANYTVLMPDLFDGDAVPQDSNGQPAIDLTEWNQRHPVSEIDRIINTTVTYIREELGVERLGGTGFCFGGKHVPRWLTEGDGVGESIDVGFIAHPSNLLPEEIDAIAGPISIAAGGLDDAFNVTARRRAEDILNGNGLTYQSNFYTGAPHGFAVTANPDDAEQVYAKEASFRQAVTWFESWL